MENVLKGRGMDASEQCEQQAANEEGYEAVITGLEQQDRSREGKCLLGPLLLKGQRSGHGQSWRLRVSVGLGLAVLLTVSQMFSSSRSRHLRTSFFPRSPRRSKAHVYRVMVTCALLSFLALSLHPFPAQAFSQTHPPDFAGIDRYVTAQMQEAHIPGLALGIVHGDHIVHLRGFGVANPAGQPVTPHTPFILGSLSKSFTAVAILQVIDAGKMELDAPVQRYLPWFRVADRNASAQMRVYQLLHQTSGLPTTAGAEAMAGTGQASLEQRVRELSTVVLTQPVGSSHQRLFPAHACPLGLGDVRTASGFCSCQFFEGGRALLWHGLVHWGDRRGVDHRTRWVHRQFPRRDGHGPEFGLGPRDPGQCLWPHRLIDRAGPDYTRSDQPADGTSAAT